MINNYTAEIQYQMPVCIPLLSVIGSYALALGTSLLSIYLAIKNNDNSIIGEFRDVEI